ncbi:MAG TPA: Gfo/Idh/MocA family oxidoreductase, partial [Clostridia bacterium]|nr:Gfo/Idh/MocA family oxidoreductase [Clostridia bacterium]
MRPQRPASNQLNRRQFLRTATTATAAVSLVPRHVLGGPNFVAPSEKINLAIIGCGGQGRTNLRALTQHPDVQVIAIADPIEFHNLDEFYYKGTAGRLPVKAEIEKHFSGKTPNFKVADYEDFRVMLQKEKAIDAILCATPDHQHAYVCVNAMRQGKHVYCEKPLTHNVSEARLVARVAKETGVATQLGNQGHSGDFIRQTCEMIWDGVIGDVREVHAWT